MANIGYSEQGQGSREKGPSTFSYDPAAPQAQGVSLGTATVQAGMSGGVSGQVALVDNGKDGTRALSQLLSIASEKLAPVAKQMQEAAFLDGMTRAAAGQEMTQIINERPWFTRIFGDTPAIEGARAYKAKEAVSQFQALSTENMRELRKRPPEAMSNYVREQFEQFATTGDPETDRLIKNSIAQQVPELIKLHTREYVKYTQEVANDAQRKSWGSSAAALQALFAPGLETTPEMVADAKAAYVAGLAPPPGADEESWKDNLLKHVELSAAAGNFHAIRAMEEMGAFAHMKVADRAKLEPIIKRYEFQYAAQEGMRNIQEEYLKATHDVSMGRVTPEELVAWMGQKSDEFRAWSGSSVGLFGLSQENQLVQSAQSARAQVLAQDYKAAQAAAAGGDTASYLMSRITDSAPRYIAATSGGGIKETEALELSRDYFNSLDRAGKVAAMVTWSQESKYAGHPTIEADLARVVNMANPDHITPDFLQAAVLYQDLRQQPGGAAAVATFFSAPHARLLDTFVKADGLGGDAKNATKAMEFAKLQADLGSIGPLPEKERNELNSFVRDKTNRGGFLFDWTRTKANPAALQIIESYMADELSSMGGYMQGTEKYEEAWGRVTKRVQPLGQFAYTIDPTKEVADLESILTKKAGGTVALNSDWVGEAADRLIKDQLKSVGGDSGNQVYLVREADTNGVANFTALEMSEDGLRAAVFTSDNLLQYINVIKDENLKRIYQPAEWQVIEMPGGAASVYRKPRKIKRKE